MDTPASPENAAASPAEPENDNDPQNENDVLIPVVPVASVHHPSETASDPAGPEGSSPKSPLLANAQCSAQDRAGVGSLGIKDLLLKEDACDCCADASADASAPCRYLFPRHACANTPRPCGLCGLVGADCDCPLSAADSDDDEDRDGEEGEGEDESSGDDSERSASRRDGSHRRRRLRRSLEPSPLRRRSLLCEKIWVSVCLYHKFILLTVHVYSRPRAYVSDLVAEFRQE